MISDKMKNIILKINILFFLLNNNINSISPESNFIENSISNLDLYQLFQSSTPIEVMKGKGGTCKLIKIEGLKGKEYVLKETKTSHIPDLDAFNKIQTYNHPNIYKVLKSQRNDKREFYYLANYYPSDYCSYLKTKHINDVKQAMLTVVVVTQFLAEKGIYITDRTLENFRFNFDGSLIFIDLDSSYYFKTTSSVDEPKLYMDYFFTNNLVFLSKSFPTYSDELKKLLLSNKYKKFLFDNSISLSEYLFNLFMDPYFNGVRLSVEPLINMLDDNKKYKEEYKKVLIADTKRSLLAKNA
ncbi:hypothetical protein AB834_03935 [PVC group bacterium (ex Bugula neritina AB1)]|nr:hypothetical protein AB834_03935 [PVC group bacterium (ex Bugula neritina AB1)]